MNERMNNGQNCQALHIMQIQCVIKTDFGTATDHGRLAGKVHREGVSSWPGVQLAHRCRAVAELSLRKL